MEKKLYSIQIYYHTAKVWGFVERTRAEAEDLVSVKVLANPVSRETKSKKLKVNQRDN